MALSEVRIAEVPSIPLAVVRRRVSVAQLAKAVPEGCGIVWEFLRAQGIRGGRNVAVYLDGSISLEVGVELDLPFEAGDVVRSATPSGTTVSVSHFGPYGQLRAAHDAIEAWCVSHAVERVGPSWEVYGHWDSAWERDPAMIRTDVHHLVRARP